MNLKFVGLVAQKAFPHWNKRPITEKEVLRYCKRKGVQVTEGRVGPSGLYTIYGGVPFIVLDPDLNGPMRLWVLLHELAHHLLHEPGLQLFDPRYESKADFEANFIAVVGILPLEWVKEKSMHDLFEEFPRPLLWARKEMFERCRT